MRKLVTNILLMGIAMGLTCAPATAGETGKTATVNVTVTVMPYAEVINFNHPSVEVKAGSPGFVTGTLTCNAPFTLNAGISQAPTGEGSWTVAPPNLSPPQG